MEKIAHIIQKEKKKVYEHWVKLQTQAPTLRLDLISAEELGRDSQKFLNLLSETLLVPGTFDLKESRWKDINQFLEKIAASRALKGFSANETATFVFSLKQPLFSILWEELKDSRQLLKDEIWDVNVLIDSLGFLTIDIFLQQREDIINHQQKELLELSTPVIKVWDNVLIVPLIGTLDSARFASVMESLLQKINDTGSTIAIIDITGVAVIDTMVAQHLLKTVSAAKLMGTECIISGIRPQIAQTIIYLGINLADVETCSTLADAMKYSFKKLELSISGK